MTIVCGTDLTLSATRAGHAAAAIAHRLRVPLKLVHVLDEIGAELAVSQEGERAYPETRARLRHEADELRRTFEIEVDAIAIPGRADSELVRIAVDAHADLIVVAAVGRTQRHRWLLGSIAEHVARHSPVPVLAVRDDRPLVAWARGERTLETMLGVDPSSHSKSALDWAARLRRIGACDLHIVQLVTPADEHARLGIGRIAEREPMREDLASVLVRDLETWVGGLPGPGATKVEVHARTEQVDLQLSEMSEAADLLVVGTHQRAGVDRWWHGSVSRGVLKHASTNVACVPRGQAVARTERAVRRVLVPTDLSAPANRAIGVAYSLVPPDGTVHLLHVVRRATDVPETERALAELIPVDSAGVVSTEISVVQSDDPAVAICQAAARLGVDLVCMATRARSSLAGLVMGSHTQRVLATADQPVVLVPPERAA